MPVKGAVKAQEGGEAHAQFTVNSVARGTFTTVKAESDPGAPAEFEATGAQPDSDPSTVEVDAIATSTAGRASAGWYARDDGAVDVTFTGHADYSRDDGATNATSEHHVTASYDWSVTYRGVSLSAAAGAVTFASVSSVTGTWSDSGRFGAAGPGSFVCGGPVTGLSGEYSMLITQSSSSGHKFNVSPFFVVQSDIANRTCTGLGSPPFESFHTLGSDLTNQAVVEFDAGDLDAGPVTLAVTPTAVVAADCSDMITSHDSPCAQTLSWSGNVTIKRSGG